MMGSFVRTAAITAVVVGSLAAPALSRQWKATPEALARDYATINDTRPNGDLVLLIWFVPQMVRPEAPGYSAMTTMLRRNVMLVAVHARLDKASGTVTFQEINTLDARNQNGRALTPIERDQLPPATIGAVTTIETMFRQSAGNMGKGMKLFVFDGTGVDSCGKGRLSVSVANETYTWDTPFPSCQSK